MAAQYPSSYLFSASNLGKTVGFDSTLGTFEHFVWIPVSLGGRRVPKNLKKHGVFQPSQNAQILYNY
jgi:hypothetical protein